MNSVLPRFIPARSFPVGTNSERIASLTGDPAQAVIGSIASDPKVKSIAVLGMP